MDYIFTVKRTRGSVTQGGATVYLNGVEVATFGDDIKLLESSDEPQSEIITGWASVTPDSDFIHGVLFHPHDDIYKVSAKVRAILKPKNMSGEIKSRNQCEHGNDTSLCPECSPLR